MGFLLACVCCLLVAAAVCEMMICEFGYLFFINFLSIVAMSISLARHGLTAFFHPGGLLERSILVAAFIVLVTLLRLAKSLAQAAVHMSYLKS